MNEPIRKLTFWNKAGYGCGDFASVLFWQTIMVYLLFFYTDVFGLTAAAAGIMFFVSRILDALFDVIIGMTADRTQSRWGKFRPYILWGAVPLAVSALLAFTTPGFGEVGKVVYAYITFILFMFLYSTVNIPYTSLLGVISGDPIERTSAASFKFVGAYLAGFIVSMTALPFAKYFTGDSAMQLEGNNWFNHLLINISEGIRHFAHSIHFDGWQTTMSLYGLAAIVFFMITFISTREKIQPIAKEKTNIANDLRDISKNMPWILLFTVTILFILFVCIRLSVTAHYFKYYIREQEVTLFGKVHRYTFEVLASAFNTVGQGFSLVGVLLVPWFAKLFGRKNALIILFTTAIVCTCSF